MKAAIAGHRADDHGLLIEGYASIFGVEDRSGDIVRPGAFASSLKRGRQKMLLQHKPGAEIGYWSRLIEDGYGLFVRGLIKSRGAERLVAQGLCGLSIGFRPQVWTLRPGPGRVLQKIELIEISLVAEPMLSEARFEVIAG